MKIINVTDPTADAAALRKKAGSIFDSAVEQTRSIMNAVSRNGDSAVLDYSAKFDGVRPDTLRVSKQEIDRAYDQVTNGQLKAIRVMKSRLEKSEVALLKRLKGITLSSEGVTIERQVRAVTSIGCYVPGGKARYPSTVVMCVVPARVAGVKRTVVISPPRKDGTVDPLTLVAADMCGVDEFYKVGGAHGIAALAYGTESIRPVNKIVGPGGMIVAAAKLVASGRVSTDMVAGPTELVIYADSATDPRLVAADLISQAEHGTDTVCGVVTSSNKLASQVQLQVERAAEKIARSEIVKSSLEQNGFIAICNKETACVDFVNEFAPEHLEIMSRKPEAIARKVDSAGLILLGSGTPSSASDYLLGSNHVLPTLGFGKSRSSLSVLDFVKVVNKVKVTKAGLKKVEASIREITAAEGLPNHYEAVKARMSG
jgi:histidinol dehydrogenase